jgi:hypothetical protein
MALIKCKECGNQVSSSAKSCPKCGAKIKSSGCFGKLFKIVLYIILGFLAISFIAYIINPPDPSKKEQKDDSKNNEVIKEEPAKIKWTGYYLGQEKCSMGRNSNEWSNPYEIIITEFGDEFELKGIYFQSRQTIKCKVSGDKLTIPEQNIGDSSFIIRGNGTRSGNKLYINFEVDVLVNFDTREYETNSCSAEFEIQ